MNAKTDDLKAGGRGKGGKDREPDQKTDAPPPPDMDAKIEANKSFGKFGAEGEQPPEAPPGAPVQPAGGPGDVSSDESTDEGTGELVQAEKRLSPRVVMEQSISDLILPQNGKPAALTLPCVLYTLIGQATNMRTGETDHGFWTAAVGDFEAKRATDGKIFRGTEAHVPGAAGELLTIELRRLITEEEPQTEEEKKRKTKRYKPNGNRVDVAVIVGIKKSSRAGGQPYEFTVQSIQQMRRSDPLAQLRQKAMSAFASLPASVKPAAVAALPAPEAEAPKT